MDPALSRSKPRAEQAVSTAAPSNITATNFLRQSLGRKANALPVRRRLIRKTTTATLLAAPSSFQTITTPIRKRLFSFGLRNGARKTSRLQLLKTFLQTQSEAAISRLF